MDESSVSFHTPKTKAQSKQWLPKGTPGPTKARVHASRRKQMVMAFFDSSGMIYEHYVPVGGKVNAPYVTEVLRKFLKVFGRKRPEVASGEWILHWDNAPVHTAAVTQELLNAKGIKTLRHPRLFPGFGSGGLLALPKGEIRALRPFYRRYLRPECVGTGHQYPPNGGLCGGLPELVSEA